MEADNSWTRKVPKQRGVVRIEKIETEADRQLKVLAHKQVEVKTTLKEQLLKRKAFAEPSVYENPNISGQLSLKEFQEKSNFDQRIAELRAYRLDQDEIDLVMAHEYEKELNRPLAKRSNYGVDPEIVRVRLEKIYAKIHQQDEELNKEVAFKSHREMSRHEIDLERAIAAREKHTTVLNKMILGSQVEQSTSQVIDPNLNAALSYIEHRGSKGSTESSESSCGSSKDTETDNLDQMCHNCARLKSQDRGLIGPLSKEELMQLEICPKCQALSKTESGLATDSKAGSSVEQCAADFNRTVVLGLEHSIPQETIERYRISLDEIRKLPKFCDYTPGEPNRTLYIKNLGVGVCDEDLPALFMRFQSPGSQKIIFKLLKGRMHGQAFVTFPDVETASKALQLVNGYNFKGKPIIIQYAKKH